MTTLDYYNDNFELFTQTTQNLTFTETQDRFLKYLKSNSFILDFGCGAGRDTKYFLDNGYKVDACDGSIKMVEIASKLTGIAVKQMLFSELKEVDTYDGIWACSSILHCSKEELKDVLEKMSRALKVNGIIYTSFKYSTFEGYRHDRYFTDFTKSSFNEFIQNIPSLEIIEYWISSDVRPGRQNEKWLNIILRNKG